MYSEQAEKTVTDACKTIQNYANADVLFAKVFDGQDWMGQYDEGSPNTFRDVQTQWADAASEGVTYIPWVVAKTPEDAVVHRELQSVGDGTIVIDLEDGPGFWQGGEFDGYLDKMLGYGPANDDYHLWVSIDMRNPVGNSSWYLRIRGLLPQCYWTTFVQDPWPTTRNLRDTITIMGGNGNAIIPVLPFDSDPEDMRTFWDVSRGWTCQAPALWRLGSANIPQLQTFGALPLGVIE
jgi:hypothetical protein